MAGKIKIPDINASTIIPTVVVVGATYFLVIDPLLKKLGLLPTKEDKGAIAIPAYSPNYHKEHPGQVTKTRAYMESAAQKIKGAFGVFRDDFTTILGVFKTLNTKSDVSFLCDVFQQKYGYDLYTFLVDPQGLFPWDGLNNTSLSLLNQYVNSLP